MAGGLMRFGPVLTRDRALSVLFLLIAFYGLGVAGEPPPARAGVVDPADCSDIVPEDSVHAPGIIANCKRGVIDTMDLDPGGAFPIYVPALVSDIERWLQALDYIQSLDVTAARGEMQEILAERADGLDTMTLTRNEFARVLVALLPIKVSGAPSSFADTEPNYSGWISSLHVNKITNGCDEQNFCGAQNVMNGQVMTFLHRALAALPGVAPPTLPTTSPPTTSSSTTSSSTTMPPA